MTNYPSGDARSDAGVPEDRNAYEDRSRLVAGNTRVGAPQFLSEGNTRTYCSLSHELRISNYSVNSPY